VIDEDDLRVDWEPIIRQAIDLGYQSVMIDGSRLEFAENVAITRQVCEIAHRHDVPVEAELGAVLGHEASPTMTYEQILETRSGFTDPDEAERFVQETGVNWLSVAFGNIHGAVSEALRDQKKVEGRLDVAHLEAIFTRIGIPIVLHGGSGIATDTVQRAIAAGIAKVNVGTDIRQEYEREIRAGSPDRAREAVYRRTRELIRDHFRISGKRAQLTGE
jgi:ketose-bisphosphate aldolase